MYNLDELLKKSVESNASDLHITVGIPPILRINGNLVPCGSENINAEETESFARKVLNDEQYEKFKSIGEIDFSYSLSGVGRFRVNIFRQRGSCAMAVRVVELNVPTIDSLGLPGVLKDLCKKTRGMVLVTGPTGSGKSTTLASMINEINSTRSCNIITLEDPIEYLYKHNKSIVNQREIGHDTISFKNALRAALREDPDVILVGEMRDLETISIAVTAAETGHLVFSTLHTIGASKTIDRILDVFPPYQQNQIKVQLAAVLEGVISQQLIPKKNVPGRVVCCEIMIATPAIRNLIREGKTHQIDTAVQTGGSLGMKTMDMALAELCRKDIISCDDAITYSMDKEVLKRMICL